MPLLPFAWPNGPAPLFPGPSPLPRSTNHIPRNLLLLSILSYFLFTFCAHHAIPHFYFVFRNAIDARTAIIFFVFAVITFPTTLAPFRAMPCQHLQIIFHPVSKRKKKKTGSIVQKFGFRGNIGSHSPFAIPSHANLKNTSRIQRLSTTAISVRAPADPAYPSLTGALPLSAMSRSPAFVPALSVPISPRTSFLTANSAPHARAVRVRPSRRAMPRMAAPPLDHLANFATLLATKADIGPFTNVDVEAAGLVAAIAGGSLIAALIAVFIVRF